MTSNKLLYYLMFGLALLSACSPVEPSAEPLPTQPLPTPTPTSLAFDKDARVDEGFTLSPGETVVIEKGMLYLTFNGVTDDSRCPTNARCIHAGWVTVSLSNNQGEVFELTLGGLLEGQVQEIEMDGVIVRLLEVQPYPDVDNPISPEEYRASFIVEYAP